MCHVISIRPPEIIVFKDKVNLLTTTSPHFPKNCQFSINHFAALKKIMSLKTFVNNL